MYDVDKERSPWIRTLLILLGVILIIFIVLFLIKACGKGEKTNNDSLEKDLLNAGKTYFNSDLLPEANGECKVVTLEVLLDQKLIEDTTKFENCDKGDTYVKVCKLSSGKYQYTPLLSCTDKRTNFGDWQDGTEDDLIADKSDVTFTYLAERLIYEDSSTTTTTTGTKRNYYPNNATSASKVNEYYVSSPASGYTYKDSGTTQASKWYVEKTIGGTLWNKGAYSATQPSGYPNKLNAKTTTSGILDTKPEEKANRTINELKVYRAGEHPQPYRYECADDNIAEHIYSFTMCERRTESTHKKTVAVYYTCLGNGSNAGSSANDVAKYTGDGKNQTLNQINAMTCPWTETSCKGSTFCQEKTAYKYTDTEWQWSTSATTVRSYYPSNSETAAGEKTYYISAPVANAIRDTSTTTSAFKFYKLVNTTTNKEIPGETKETWVKVTEDYVSESDLIKALKDLNFEVSTLKDIENHDELRYSVKLEYRNRTN